MTAHFCFTMTTTVWLQAHPGVCGMPAKKQRIVIKGEGKKPREVFLKGGGVPNMPGIPRSRAMPSGGQVLWRMAMSVRNLPHLTGPLSLPAIINLSLVKYKDCKSQHEPALFVCVGGCSSISEWHFVSNSHRWSPLLSHKGVSHPLCCKKNSVFKTSYLKTNRRLF